MKRTTKIKSIAAELKDCKAAWVKYPNAKWAWCCHHEKHFEALTEPASNRINFIVTSKPKKEQAVRLRNFRPVKDAAKRKALCADYAAKHKPLYADYAAKHKPLDADYAAKRKALCADYEAKHKALYADYAAKRKPLDASLRKLHKSEWPNNTWTGRSIFK